jgi:exodeoxyribonuclease V alpha subunit
MSDGVPPTPAAPAEREGGRDRFAARLALVASGALREFNRAGVLSASDVHVARRLGALAGESEEAVLLAVALAVRAPRIGHVLVDLASIAETAAVDTEDPVDLDTLRWPAPDGWIAAVAASPLVGREPARDEQAQVETDGGPHLAHDALPSRRGGG